MKYDFIYPNILECVRFVGTNANKADERIVTDYEIDFNITGGRTMYVDGREYKINDNSIVCRVPGQRVSSIGDFNMYMLTLDFSKSIPSRSEIRQSNHITQPEFDSYFWDVIPTYFEPIHFADISSQYKELIYRFNCNGKKEEIDPLIASLIHQIVSDAFFAKVEKKEKSDAVFKAISYMTENYSKKFCLSDISSEVFLNKSYLIRLFKNETGITPIKYLNNIRMSQAILLLKNSDLSVFEISKKCGYSSESYFIVNFKRQYGCTPEQYRIK